MTDKTATIGDTIDLPIDEIKPYWRNPRRLTKESIEAVAVSIQDYGYQQPIVVDSEHVVVVGHTRLAALKSLGYTTVPVRVTNLPADKVREYRIVDNKTSELTSWDHNALVLELREFETDLLERYFPDVDLEISMLENRPTTEKEVDAGTKKALTLKEPGEVATVGVTCPACVYRFTVKASALPGISSNDVDALSQ